LEIIKNIYEIRCSWWTNIETGKMEKMKIVIDERLENSGFHPAKFCERSGTHRDNPFNRDFRGGWDQDP
jgi:hypothetical protein